MEEELNLPDWIVKSGNKPDDFEFKNNDFVWLNGTWYGGTWYNGKWYNGKWYNGKWKKGTWYNGTWENGMIYSKKFKRYIDSEVNPKKFYEIEKQSQSIEELKNKVK